MNTPSIAISRALKSWKMPPTSQAAPLLATAAAMIVVTGLTLFPTGAGVAATGTGMTGPLAAELGALVSLT